MNRKAGLTIIEILITIGILAIIFTIGVVGFLQVRDSQASRAGVNSIRQIILQGTTAAASRGQTLELVRLGNRLQVRTTVGTPVVLRSVDLPASIASQVQADGAGKVLGFSPPGRVIFPTDFSNPFSITDRGHTYALTVSLIGEVTLEGN